MLVGVSQASKSNIRDALPAFVEISALLISQYSFHYRSSHCFQFRDSLSETCVVLRMLEGTFVSDMGGNSELCSFGFNRVLLQPAVGWKKRTSVNGEIGENELNLISKSIGIPPLDLELGGACCFWTGVRHTSKRKANATVMVLWERA